MLIEIAAPASLPLCLAHVDTEAGRKTCLLGVTVQHPPVQLSAGAHASFAITGPRADRVLELAKQFRAARELSHSAIVEIELAIPAYMGLSSETMMSLSLARALAWVNGLPMGDTVALARDMGLGPHEALAVWGFDRGGLLAVEFNSSGEEPIPPIVKRYTVSHAEKDAWAFVFMLPRVPEDTPPVSTSEHIARLAAAALHLSEESAQVTAEQLWPALENDDLSGFAKALTSLHDLNQEALAGAGLTYSLTPEELFTLEVMRESGAVACGRNAAGMGIYALVEGGDASRVMRTKLRHRLGYDAGWALATITDNDGAQHVVRDENLVAMGRSPIRPRSDLDSS